MTEQHEDEIERLDTLNAEALAALWKIADHIPELWGDECKDGYIRLNISADAIEAVQAAICQKVSDIKRKLSDATLPEALEVAKSFIIANEPKGKVGWIEWLEAKNAVIEAIRKAKEAGQ